MCNNILQVLIFGNIYFGIVVFLILCVLPYQVFLKMQLLMGRYGQLKLRLVFMLFYPYNFDESHLQIFKRLAKILEDISFRQTLLEQKTSQGVYETICKYEEMLGDMYV